MDLTEETSHSTKPLTGLVTAYYHDIDRQDLDSALACFAPDAVYRRPGYAELTGIDAIVAFYREQRIISAGRHNIESVIENADEVAVRGSFRGRSRTGAPLAVRFADFWRFTDRRVVERNTYFDAVAV